MKKQLLVVLSTLLVLIGCASKPDQELTAAQSALDQAKAAEAETYAGADYQTATDTLKSAQAEMAAQDEKFALTRSYEKAKQLLADAKSEAEAAASAAAANKEKVKAEAEAGQTAAQQAIDGAKTALAKAPKGKGTKADLEALQGDLTAAETSFGEVQTAFQNGQYMDAKNGFEAVKTKAESITSEVEQAIAKKKK